MSLVTEMIRITHKGTLVRAMADMAIERNSARNERQFASPLFSGRFRSGSCGILEVLSRAQRPCSLSISQRRTQSISRTAPTSYTSVPTEIVRRRHAAGRSPRLLSATKMHLVSLGRALAFGREPAFRLETHCARFRDLPHSLLFALALP